MDKSKIKRSIMIVVFVLLISIMGITMGGRYKVTLVENTVAIVVIPIQKVFYTIGNSIEYKMKPILSVWSIKEENERLVEENNKLKNELIKKTLTDLQLKELQNLKKALNYTDKTGIDNYISADVVSKEQGNWFNLFTIDVGSNQGLTKNSAVINGSGLIGLVYEVGDNWSKVISIIDNKASVGFRTLNDSSNYMGQSNGSSDFKLRGYLFDPRANIKVGTTLITSGLGVYPKGILIGKVSDVNVDRNELLTNIVIEPFVDFKHVDKVLVIPYEELN